VRDIHHRLLLAGTVAALLASHSAFAEETMWSNRGVWFGYDDCRATQETPAELLKRIRAKDSSAVTIWATKGSDGAGRVEFRQGDAVYRLWSDLAVCQREAGHSS
jgi:hypothetical protein